MKGIPGFLEWRRHRLRLAGEHERTTQDEWPDDLEDQHRGQDDPRHGDGVLRKDRANLDRESHCQRR
jgi:hypothetical protein